VKEGYKQSEIGVIPEDWDAVLISELTSEVGDGIHSTPTYSSNGNYYFINGNNLDNGKIVVNQDTKRADLCEFKRHKRNLSDRSILLSINGTIGNLAFYQGESIILGKSAAYLNIKKEFSKQYVYFSLQTNSVKQSFEDRLTGTTIRNLGLGAIRNTLIAVPKDYREQKAIAQALSDADAAIAELDRLITKKRNIRQGATQQLLTGKKRLSGFGEGKGYKQTEIGIIPEDWNVHKISALVDNNRIPSGIYKEKGLYGKGTKIIKLGDVFSFDYFNPANAQRVFLNKDELLIYRVCVNDIFIALASVKLEGVGKVMLVTHLDEDTAYDHNVALIRTNNLVEPIFLFYLLKSNLIRKQVAKLSTQVGTTFLKSSTILAFHLAIPAVKAEQTSITAILSDIDIEIEALEQKRDKYKAIKQGMMQELLTGRTRLI